MSRVPRAGSWKFSSILRGILHLSITDLSYLFSVLYNSLKLGKEPHLFGLSALKIRPSPDRALEDEFSCVTFPLKFSIFVFLIITFSVKTVIFLGNYESYNNIDIYTQ